MKKVLLMAVCAMAFMSCNTLKPYVPQITLPALHKHQWEEWLWKNKTHPKTELTTVWVERHCSKCDEVEIERMRIMY